MPGMTMVYRVKDPAMLDQVKAGEKVTFSMEKVGGQWPWVAIRLMLAVPNHPGHKRSFNELHQIPYGKETDHGDL
jgi:hypothetical protein